MLNQQTIEKLHAMKLHGIADAFRAQLETTEAAQLSTLINKYTYVLLRLLGWCPCGIVERGALRCQEQALFRFGFRPPKLPN
jgi:hypothetical protein